MAVSIQTAAGTAFAADSADAADSAGAGGLGREPVELPDWSRLDAAQRAGVLAAGSVRRVVGAPGTGKTTVAVHRILHAVRGEGLGPHQCLLIAPSRVQAGRLRERLSRALAATTSHVPVRTMESLAFSLVRSRAQEEATVAPQLITGAEQDVILRELLAGHAAGHGRVPHWPESLREATTTRGLRAELRELLMRLAEHGVGAGHLRALAAAHEVPVWAAAADVLAEYEEVSALSRPGALDSAGLLAQAIAVLSEASEAGPAGQGAAAAPVGAAALVGGLRLVVVDDAQELTRAGVVLLARLADLGVRLLLVGDPDVATQTFRGAQPHALLTAWRGEPEYLRPPLPGLGLGEQGAGSASGAVVLRTCHRAGPEVVAVADRVAAQIGTAGVAAHRQPLARGPRGASSGVEVAVTPSAAHEARHIAMTLRRAHLQEGVPWEQLAVIVRSGSQAAALRRALSAESVPVTVPGARVPLRDEPAVRPLLTLLALSLSPRPWLPATGVVDLMTSRLIGADSLGVRAARRDLRRHAQAHGHTRGSDELLVAALQLADATHESVRAELTALPAPLRRIVRAVAAGRRAAGLHPPGEQAGAADGSAAQHGQMVAAPPAEQQLTGATPQTRVARRVGVDEVLWAIWSSLGLADRWRAQAVRGGSAGARADRDLDAVCALFDAAGRYVERLPGSSPRGFLDHVAAQEIAADSLVARRVRAGEVTLTTPAGAVGGQWHTVVVAGLQEGAWPDLRPRGSTLRVPELLDALGDVPLAPHEAAAPSTVDTPDRLRRLRHDEARLLLLAVSRARTRLLVTAVRDEENQPSAYLDVIDPQGHSEQSRPFAEAVRPLTVAGVVADLRRRLAGEPAPAVRAALARRLARFADAGVATADPARWWGGNEPTDERPVWPGAAQVPVSPSRVEAFTRCGLRWLLTSCGGQSTHESVPVAIGNLVHEIAAEVDNDDAGLLRAALAQRWPRLGLGQGWLAQRHYELAESMLSLLARYDAQASAQGWRVVGRELPVRVDVGRATVTGRVDRLEVDAQGRLRVVDLKTGAGKPARADVARLPQLGAYQVAVQAGAFGGDLGSASAGAALLQVGKAAGTKPTLQVQPALAADEDPQWAETLVREVADAMASDHVEARVGEACRTCPVLDSCPLQAARWTL
ncbi:UvrD/REP helicase family protein [Kineosphaera limosa NBRC 100340]|uniref:DNA 3'-5' helicase n=1 Tax=Kineosphaera limosa NBRC 100340 TaxID=1184609 RepID=K6XEC7_9MICO|nr:UrvD/REP family ATP-dependent DNA helicase [Kineosphaera limosa]GAB97179.1 UvrD/REP helicase family protein [Kineosphaera limosa NBRC 100340]